MRSSSRSDSGSPRHETVAAKTPSASRSPTRGGLPRVTRTPSTAPAARLEGVFPPMPDAALILDGDWGDSPDRVAGELPLLASPAHGRSRRRATRRRRVAPQAAAAPPVPAEELPAPGARALRGRHRRDRDG